MFLLHLQGYLFLLKYASNTYLIRHEKLFVKEGWDKGPVPVTHYDEDIGC
jgi:hypothetical protein